MLRAHLLAGKLASEAKLAALEREVAREVAAAIELALASPDPDPVSALSHVYAV